MRSGIMLTAITINTSLAGTRQMLRWSLQRGMRVTLTHPNSGVLQGANPFPVYLSHDGPILFR